MSKKTTPKGDIGAIAPDFKLLATNNQAYTLANCQGEKGTLVMFICNHCPYVKAILHKIIRDTTELHKYGISSVAIMSNNPNDYPEDSFSNMKKIAKKLKYPFPYLLDETQDVAKNYGAVCTPDFFGYDKNLTLRYRGRLDDSRMEDKPDAKRELFEAMKSIASTSKGSELQKPSIGCSIKWY